MEGSGAAQPAAPYAPPAPAPKNKRMMIAVVIVVVVVVVIAALAIVLLSNGNATNPSGTWDPQVGQYIDYSMKMGGASYATIHMVVKSMTSTTITWNETATIMGSTTSHDMTVEKGQAAGATLDLSSLPAGYSGGLQGKAVVSTNWGNRNCDHYHITYNSGDTSGTMDMYLYGNVLLKMDVSGSGTSMSMTLTGTNVSLVTQG
jgi:hypothetical protein